MELVLYLLCLVVATFAGIEDVISIDTGLNEEPQVAPPETDPNAPIINNQPDVVPNSDIDDESWFEHKYIAATLESHMISIIVVAAISFIVLVLCIICGCKKYKNKAVNDDDDYATEIDVERQPFT